jgi:uncharacterized protein
MATVTVRGRAVVPAEPDEATVVLELSSRRQTADAAYGEVAERNAQLRAIFDELGIPAASRSTEGIWVGPHIEYVEGQEEHRGYRALNRVAVRLADADVVARLVQEGVTRADARVQGPAWRIRPDNPAYVEARRLAAENARERAATYAAALGVRLGALERVAETDVAQDGPPAVRSFAALDATPQIDVEAGERLVRAAVDVSFVLEQE